jgi:hypothetical protein
MDHPEAEWQRKGATLSDRTAQKEFGLTTDQIARAIRGGRLRFRIGSIHGNPFFRLLRREVEALVEQTRGNSYLEDRRTATEVARIDRELKQLKKQIAALEARKAKLVAASSRPRPGSRDRRA